MDAEELVVVHGACPKGVDMRFFVPEMGVSDMRSS
jgi:hypothetical protein